MGFFKSKSNENENSRVNAATDIAALLLPIDSDKALEVLSNNEDLTSPKFWRTKFSVHEQREEFNAAIQSLVQGYELGDNRCCAYLVKLIEVFPTAAIASDTAFMEKLEKDVDKLYQTKDPELIWALAKLAQLRSDNDVFLANLLALQLSLEDKHPAQSGGGALMNAFAYARLSHHLGEDLGNFLSSNPNESQIDEVEKRLFSMFEKLDEEIASAWRRGIPDWDGVNSGSTLLFFASALDYFQHEFDEGKLGSTHAIPTFNFLLDMTNAFYEVPKPMQGFTDRFIAKKSKDSLEAGDAILYLNAASELPEHYGLTNEDLEAFEEKLEAWGLMPYMDLIRQS